MLLQIKSRIITRTRTRVIITTTIKAQKTTTMEAATSTMARSEDLGVITETFASPNAKTRTESVTMIGEIVIIKRTETIINQTRLARTKRSAIQERKLNSSAVSYCPSKSTRGSRSDSNDGQQQIYPNQFLNGRLLCFTATADDMMSYSGMLLLAQHDLTAIANISFTSLCDDIWQFRH